MSISPLSPYLETDVSRTGTYTSINHGSGTFALATAASRDSRSVQTTFTGNDGKSSTDSITASRQDGSVTTSSSWTYNSGGVGTTDLAWGPKADHVRSFSGQATTPEGSTDTVTGSASYSDGVRDTTRTITNAAGQTETRNSEFTKSTEGITEVTTGTDFAGAQTSGGFSFSV